MNVVITLPKHLVKAIIAGEKFCEIRTKFPLRFDWTRDVVFVVQKRTKKVPLYFTIEYIFQFSSSNNRTTKTEKYLAEKAAVSLDYIKNYRKGKEKIYVWVIGCACKVSCPSYLYTDLKIEKNPQSFIYRDYEWRKVHFKSYVWLEKTHTLRPGVEYKKYYRSLSSAKPSTL